MFGNRLLHLVQFHLLRPGAIVHLANGVEIKLAFTISLREIDGVLVSGSLLLDQFVLLDVGAQDHAFLLIFGPILRLVHEIFVLLIGVVLLDETLRFVLDDLHLPILPRPRVHLFTLVQSVLVGGVLESAATDLDGVSILSVTIRPSFIFHGAPVLVLRFRGVGMTVACYVLNH